MVRFTKVTRLMFHGKESRYYYVRVTRSNKSRTWKCTGCEILKTAKAVVEEWKVREARGDCVFEGKLFAEALNQFAALKESRTRPSTFKYYHRFFDMWREEWKARMLGEIKSAEVQAYMERVKAEHKESTTNTHLNVLRSFFLWCVDEGLLHRSPAKRVSTWKAERKAIRVLDAAEEARLLTSASMEGDRIYGYVLALIETGFRTGTAEHVEWSHVDFPKGQWSVPAALMKSGRPYKDRPISAPLLEWLARNRRADGLIFGPVHEPTWKRIVKRAGLLGLKRHDLRRSFITRCRRANIDMETTMWLSDHSDIGVVAKCYRRVDASDAAKAMNGTA